MTEIIEAALDFLGVVLFIVFGCIVLMFFLFIIVCVIYDLCAYFGRKR